MLHEALLLQPARLDFENCVWEDNQFYSWSTIESMFESDLAHAVRGTADNLQLKYAELLDVPEGDVVGVVMQVMCVVPTMPGISKPGRVYHRLEVVTWDCYLHASQPQEMTPRLRLRQADNQSLLAIMPERQCLDLYRTTPQDHVVYLLTLDEFGLLQSMSKKLDFESDLFYGAWRPFEEPRFSEAETELYNSIQEPACWAAFALRYISEAVAVIRQEVEPKQLSLQVLVEQEVEEEDEEDEKLN